VKVSNPFNSIATDPVKRIIRVHAKSIAKARKGRHCDGFVATSSPCDARQCRIVVNALRREIDRLMRGINRYALCSRPRFADPLTTRLSCNVDERGGGRHAEARDVACAPSGLKSYAAPALGPVLAPPSLAALGDRGANYLNNPGRAFGETLVDLLA